MTNRFYHAASTDTVQFSRAPNRGNGQRLERNQSIGYDSAGAQYIYNRNNNQRINHTLVYPQQSADVLAALLIFVESRGNKDLFTWDDHAGVAHICRFSDATVSYTETGADRYRLEIAITEEP